MIRRGYLLGSVTVLCFLSLSTTVKRSAREPITLPVQNVVSSSIIGDPYALRKSVKDAVARVSRKNQPCTFYWDLLQSYHAEPRDDPSSYHGSSQHSISMEAIYMFAVAWTGYGRRRWLQTPSRQDTGSASQRRPIGRTSSTSNLLRHLHLQQDARPCSNHVVVVGFSM